MSRWPKLSIAEFERAMKPIFETFGTAEYPAPRVKLIYDDVDDLTEIEFRQIVKHFCKTKPVKYPPLPTHFHEEAHNVRKARLQPVSTVLPVGIDVRDGPGLEHATKAFGAGSAYEAVQKFIRKQNQEPK